ncbi:DUF6461 domain-containing protein [Streptomyces sp. NPDC058001]|uniref:DUF6461 domain-containing protein n=1 Tax=Streptomyces sp. NPDC058001 TaxID=3346300 RepID=UPI0036EC4C6F
MDGVTWMADVFDTYCATFARGLDVEELVRGLGGDPARILPAVSDGDAFTLAMDEGPVARLGTCAGWAFALEHWSAEGMDRATLRRVSAGTEAVVLLDSGTPPKWFLYARDGEVVADFEPGVEAAQMGGADPASLVPALHAAGLLHADGTTVPDTDPSPLILGMTEQAFGLSLPREPLEHGVLPAVVLTRS